MHGQETIVSIIGRVDSVWRYPVKSMKGEELQEAFVGFAGIYGDRLYAFRSSAAPTGFPYLTGREQEQMLLFRPVFRHPERMKRPPNLAEAQALAPGVTPLYAEPAEATVDVKTPSGELLPIDDPRLISELRDGIRERHELTLLRSDRALTDCRPVSLFATGTVRQLGSELGVDLDKRRFRANIYVELKSGMGFGEDQLVRRNLRIGTTQLMVVDRDPRCKMITLDPDTAKPNPEVLKLLARSHEGKAGIYGAVLVEGIVRPGDEIELLN